MGKIQKEEKTNKLTNQSNQYLASDNLLTIFMLPKRFVFR